MKGPSVSEVHPALARLRALDRAGLLARYRELYGTDAPTYLSQPLLVNAIAYRIQEQDFRSIKPSVRRALVSGQLVVRRQANAGTVLIREWHGQHHTVRVDESGVEYRGERFRSLTEVVFRITGQKRSGPAFFGLRGADRGQR